MKKFIVAALVGILILPAISFAQSPADFVRNSKTVPDVWNTQLGWNHNVALDKDEGIVHYSVYVNQKQGLVAIIASISYPNKPLDDFMMMYVGDGVARTGIKVDGQWYLSVGPFEDNGKSMPENDIQATEIYDQNSGSLIGARLELNTLDGLKFRNIP